MTTIKHRLKKGLKRARRGALLTKVTAEASALYKTGVQRQQQYGCMAMGLAPEQRAQARTAARLSAGSAGVAPCVTTLLAWRLGGEADPSIQAQADHLRKWMKLWSSFDAAYKKEVTTSWRLARSALEGMHSSARWRRASDAMTSTIVVILEAGWHPLQPNHWWNADRTMVATPDTSLHAQCEIVQAFKEDLLKSSWAKASHHLGGAGLETGEPSFTATRRARKWFIKEGLAAEVSALDAAVCGGFAPKARWGKGDEALCKCGMRDSLEHRYYSCKILKEIPDDHNVLRSSHWLVKPVCTGEWQDRQCMWARGILPCKLWDFANSSVDFCPEIVLGKYAEATLDNGRCCSDGSGGERMHPKIHQEVWQRRGGYLFQAGCPWRAPGAQRWHCSFWGQGPSNGSQSGNVWRCISAKACAQRGPIPGNRCRLHGQRS